MYGEGLESVSEGWRQLRELSTTTDPNISATVHEEEHFCKLILYKEIQDSRVRIWDVMILIPNLLFLLFIAVRFNRARLKLRATSSPIFLAFYGLVICNVLISVIRCVVSMTVNAAATFGGKADKVLWVIVRFFLLSTEMSVVIFGLFFGHLDSRSSIRRVLLATSFIALAYTITQGTLEIVLPDDMFYINSKELFVFGHGGMMFWFISSLVFTTIYMFMLILPLTRLRERLALPNKRSFYVYVGILAFLNLVQSIGAGLLNYTQNLVGLCVVDVTAIIYLTIFTPLVYHTFLSEFLGVSQPSLMFSYKAQVDDAMEEDTVSLPHQQSFSSLKTDSDYIYQVHVPSFHMPFHESQITKNSPKVKQTSSLYSLTSRRADPNTSRYSSQIKLYGTSPSGKRSSKRLIAQQSTPDLGKYTLTSSGNNFSGTQKIPSHLEAPSWKTRSVSLIGHGDFVQATTATSHSHFAYRPKKSESVTQFLSESSKSSLDSESLRVKTKRSKSIVNDDSNSEKLMKKANEKSSSPLESSLQSLLSGESHEMKRTNDSVTKDI